MKLTSCWDRETRSTIMFPNFVFHFFKEEKHKKQTIVGAISTIDLIFSLFFCFLNGRFK